MSQILRNKVKRPAWTDIHTSYRLLNIQLLTKIISNKFTKKHVKQALRPGPSAVALPHHVSTTIARPLALRIFRNFLLLLSLYLDNLNAAFKSCVCTSLHFVQPSSSILSQTRSHFPLFPCAVSHIRTIQSVNLLPLFTMDDTQAAIAMAQLVAKYPEISMTTVADVLQACDQDPVRAYETICEMIIPPDHETSTDVTTHSQTTVSTDTTTTTFTSPLYPPTSSIKSSPPRAPREVTYAMVQPSPLSPAPRSVAPEPRGAWASANMGRRYRVDELCKCYTWLSRSIAEALFEKYGDCLELVETEVLSMFPVDEPAAFAGDDGNQSSQPLSQVPRSRSPDAAASRVADALRERDEDELRRVARAHNSTSMSSRSMHQLRCELWEKRKMLTRFNALASQTRQTKHINQARELSEELSKLSAYLLDRIQQSEEYRDGCLDLHGLTKDEAIELVCAKLNDGPKRRFRVITGKGIHSQNGQAVLRPALEKYLQRRGVKYSHYEQGIISVIP